MWPSPFLISDDDKTAVRSFSQMDPKLGVNQKADELIQKIHEKEMKIVISIPIATTSLEHEWFLNSASASKTPNANYSQLYTWVSKAADSNFFTEHKNLFYLHEKGIGFHSQFQIPIYFQETPNPPYSTGRIVTSASICSTRCQVGSIEESMGSSYLELSTWQGHRMERSLSGMRFMM